MTPLNVREWTKSEPISDAILPALYPQKSWQHVLVCAARVGAILCKKIANLSYRDSPNTRNSSLLLPPSPIMAPGGGSFFGLNNMSPKNKSNCYIAGVSPATARPFIG